jgi:hypothetical protein
MMAIRIIYAAHHQYYNRKRKEHTWGISVYRFSHWDVIYGCGKRIFSYG